MHSINPNFNENGASGESSSFSPRPQWSNHLLQKFQCLILNFTINNKINFRKIWNLKQWRRDLVLIYSLDLLNHTQLLQQQLLYNTLEPNYGTSLDLLYPKSQILQLRHLQPMFVRRRQHLWLIPTISYNKSKGLDKKDKLHFKVVKIPKIYNRTNLEFNKLSFYKAQHQTRLPSSNIPKKHLMQNIKHHSDDH